MKWRCEPEAGSIVRCTNDYEPGVVSFRAKVDGRKVGRLDTYLNERDALTVGVIEVDKAYRRSRIGTRLYEAAAREACRQGKVLGSDSLRSPFAEAFWLKQIERGRARCVGSGGDTFEAHRAPAGLPQPTIGPGGKLTWPCFTFEVKAPCAVTSLEGVRRKRRR